MAPKLPLKWEEGKVGESLPLTALSNGSSISQYCHMTSYFLFESCIWYKWGEMQFISILFYSNFTYLIIYFYNIYSFPIEFLSANNKAILHAHVNNLNKIKSIGKNYITRNYITQKNKCQHLA